MTPRVADRITVTLHELVALLDAYADDVLRAEHGITFGDYRYLATLAELDRPDITELARCLMLTRAAVSKHLPALEGRGWVERSADPAHARRVVVGLTPAGVRVVEEAGGRLDADFAAAFTSGHPPLDLDALHAGLRTAVMRVQEKLAGPPPR